EAGHLEFHFSDYWNIVVRRRKLIALFIAIGLAGAAAASFLAKPLYKAAAVLSVEKDRGGPVEISTVDQGGASYDPEFLPTQMRLIKSREIAERVARQLNLANTAETLPAKSGLFRSADKDAGSKNALTMAALWVQGATDVQPVRGTTLVEVSCLAKTPRQAAEIANALADAYVAWSVENRFRALDETSQFLSGQIQQLRAD